jgi:hypothetical protein
VSELSGSAAAALTLAAHACADATPTAPALPPTGPPATAPSAADPPPAGSVAALACVDAATSAPPRVLGLSNGVELQVDGLASDDEHLAIALVDAPTPSEEDLASFASPLCAVTLEPRANRTVADDSSHVNMVVTLPTEPPLPSLSNRSCSTFDGHAANETCIAGCCMDGVCVCRLGYAGERCEYELRCAVARTRPSTGSSPDGLTWQLGDECETTSEPPTRRGGRTSLVCSCRQLGVVTIMRLRVLPPMNVIGGKHWLPIAREGTASSSPYVGALVGVVAAVSAALFVAHLADAVRLYVGPECDALPCAIRPSSPYVFVNELVGCVLTHTMVLRVVFVYRGFTPYSHAQLVCTLLNSLATSACVLALFLGRSAEHELCSGLLAALAGIAFTMLSNVFVFLFRRTFKWANRSDAPLRAFRSHYKHVRKRVRAQHTQAVRAPSPVLKRLPTTESSRPALRPSEVPTLVASAKNASLTAASGAEQTDEPTVDCTDGEGGTEPDVGKGGAERGDGHLMTLCRRALGGQRARDKVATLCVRLSAAHVAVGPDGIALGLYLRDSDKSEGEGRFSKEGIRRGEDIFVPIQCLQRYPSMLPLKSSTSLLVYLARVELPQNAQTVEAVLRCVVNQNDEPALLRPAASRWKLLVAWALNLSLLAGAVLLLMLIILSRTLLPRTLQATAVSDAEWHAAYQAAIALAVFQNLVVVDALKALSFAATAPGGPVERCVTHRCKLLKKPLRRLYWLLDAQQ